jgi:group I intron endonuclease
MRGIYKITNIINSKVYIGESLDIIRRWEEHKVALNNNEHHSYKLQADWNKHGENN